MKRRNPKTEPGLEEWNDDVEHVAARIMEAIEGYSITHAAAAMASIAEGLMADAEERVRRPYAGACPRSRGRRR
jgi:hypothetical protein